jgi:F0F1-type ATP synthase membrane subunit c/vacuolar-type H+-ATPase subunit K
VVHPCGHLRPPPPSPLVPCLLFVKAAKVIALASVFAPITGCAVGTGIIYAALIHGCAYAPEQEEILFNYASLGFAFVETFAFILVAAAVLIIVL